jgi:hypothetical protein
VFVCTCLVLHPGVDGWGRMCVCVFVSLQMKHSYGMCERRRPRSQLPVVCMNPESFGQEGAYGDTHANV